MNNTHLPPLPKADAVGPAVCEVIRLYLAVWDDLTPEQKQVVSAHVQNCANCSSTRRLMHQATQLVATLRESSPSSRVNQAVAAAIAARSGHASTPLLVNGRRHPGASLRLAGLVAAAAVVMLTVLMTVHFMTVSSLQSKAFLPATLSWSAYVLYNSQTRIDRKGERYRIDCYHQLGTGNMHVETVMGNTMDIVVVSDTHSTLGLDMMHHIAQHGADEWSIDESMFNLAQLRSDMQAGRAIYLDEDDFRGQPVYRIRGKNGLVLLLDMNYMPVNVLRGAVGPGTGEPIYDTLQLLSSSKVPASMWNMKVPPGFQMGTLPEKS